MNNRKILILLICLFTIQFYLFNCTTINNEVNNKEIKISQLNKLNTSYTFNFNSNLEKIIIQIKIFDVNDSIIWLSDNFNNINRLELKDVNFISFNSVVNKGNIYYLKVHKTYYHFESNNTQTSYLDTFIIKE